MNTQDRLKKLEAKDDETKALKLVIKHLQDRLEKIEDIHEDEGYYIVRNK